MFGLALTLAGLKALVMSYAPWLFFIAMLGLGYFAIQWYRTEEEIPTVRVYGYDPSTRRIEFREVEKQGEQAIWHREEAEDIRFIPKSETIHDTPYGPAWLLDLSDGRTMFLTESSETVRTTGQELQKAVEDDTVQQALQTSPSQYEFYLKMLVMMAPVMIILLIIIAIMVFQGSG